MGPAGAGQHARRGAAEIGVKITKPVDQSGIDRALRDLFGRIEGDVIALERCPQRPAAERCGPFGEAIEQAQVALDPERPVVEADLAAQKEIACAKLARSARDEAIIVARSNFGRDERRRGIDCVKLCRSRRPEISDVGAVWSLGVVDLLDKLGDDEVEVAIALAVAVGPQIDRHAVDEGREVRAMIEVEAAQEILVGLAAARVLGCDQTGNDFKQLADALDGPVVEVDLADLTLRRRCGNADQVRGAPGDDDGRAIATRRKSVGGGLGPWDLRRLVGHLGRWSDGL